MEGTSDLHDWEALEWRELSLVVQYTSPRRELSPIPWVQGVGGLLGRTATDRKARPHLMESHKGMQSPAFNS